MQEYFSGFEFDSEDDVYNCFNANEYLKKRPILKEEVVKNALEYL